MIEGMSLLLDKKLKKVANITELISLHDNFIDAIYKNCLNSPESLKYSEIIIETLKLAKIVKDEWRNVESLASLDESGDIVDSASLYDLDKNAIEIEKTFGVCEYQLKMMFDNLD